MDAQKFGAFVAENRKAKGMTQAELARQIHVTDKAVSRWERGVGFPDIHSLEPLARALGLSVLELMKSEKLEESSSAADRDAELMKAASAMQRQNRKRDITATSLAIFTTAAVAPLAWLAGVGNVGASVFFGMIAAIAQVCLFYFMEHIDDAQSRKIYAVIGSIALAVIALLLWFALT